MSDKLRYEECFVAYLDILGFKNRVRETERDKSALEETLNFFKEAEIMEDSSGKHDNGDKINLRFYFFSDSFVLFMKEEDKNKIDRMFFIIRYMQDRLWTMKLCLRGAITKGKMYWPKDREKIVIGPALVEAHKIESEMAFYPRVVISGDVYEEMRNADAPTLSDEGVRLVEFANIDKDGMCFFDTLNKKISRKKGEKIVYVFGENEGFSIITDKNQKETDIYKTVEDVCKKGLKSKNEKTRQKCEWLKSYLEEARGNR